MAKFPEITDFRSPDFKQTSVSIFKIACTIFWPWLWKKSFKVHLFVDLIGKLKNIIDSEKEVDEKESKPCESSVPEEWNELLCEIIILATFTKIKKAEF